MMHKSIQALLTGLIDYAGLFPPAALDMPTAVRNYAAYRSSEYGWMLGRFVVPVARLAELEAAAADHLPLPDANEAWLLTVLAGADLNADLTKIAEFNQRHEQRVLIDTLEIKTASAAEIQQAAELAHGKLAVYCEIPIADDPAKLVNTIADAELRAKVRTGGVIAEAFPSSHDLARFIATCAEADVPFKATAGLHHPLRSVNRLTYEPDSAPALMHGFLNVFIAAGFAQFGLETERLVEILEERAPETFVFDSGGVRWRDNDLVLAHLRNTRSLFAISFGSCSFTEPLEDLQRLGLL
jgi:hypothetical protein